MRTSLKEIEEIEHVLKYGKPGDLLLLEAKMALNVDLKRNVIFQKKVYEVIQRYGRLRIKTDIARVDHDLFHNSRHQRFQNKIKSFFKEQ